MGSRNKIEHEPEYDEGRWVVRLPSLETTEHYGSIRLNVIGNDWRFRVSDDHGMEIVVKPHVYPENGEPGFLVIMGQTGLYYKPFNQDKWGLFTFPETFGQRTKILSLEIPNKPYLGNKHRSVRIDKS